MSRPIRWNLLARLLHWLMAIGLIGNLVLGKVVHEMDLSPDKLRTLMVHKSIGITLLALAIVRLLWALMSRAPAPVVGLMRLQHLVARLTHGLLYLCMLALPISGWVVNSAANVPMSWFGLFQIPDPFQVSSRYKHDALEVHEFLAMTLIVLISLHAAAALYHHVVRRDATLRRMLFGKITDSEEVHP